MAAILPFEVRGLFVRAPLLPERNEPASALPAGRPHHMIRAGGGQRRVARGVMRRRSPAGDPMANDGVVGGTNE